MLVQPQPNLYLIPLTHPASDFRDIGVDDR